MCLDKTLSPSPDPVGPGHPASVRREECSLHLIFTVTLLSLTLQSLAGMYQVYIRYISGMYQVCIRYISGIYQVYIRYVSGMYQVYIRYVSGIYQVCIIIILELHLAQCGYFTVRSTSKLTQ